jgi:hypothetical protein
MLDLFSSLREDETYILIRKLYERWQPATKEYITIRRKMMNPNEIARKVHGMQEEWAHLENIVPPMKHVSSNLWCSPNTNKLMINVDGGLNIQSRDGGVQ